MTKRFPKFQSHNEASCFNCGGDFGDGYPSKSGDAVGSGAHQQNCCKCSMWTWYDLKGELPKEKTQVIRVEDIRREQMTTQVTIFQSQKYRVTIEMEHGARYYQVRRLTDGQSVSFGIDHSRGMLKELSDNALDFWGVEDSWFM